MRKEFYEETGHMFHMYTMASFLSFFIENKGKSIDKATIDEVELFTSVMKKKVSRAELKEYYESLEDQEERQAAKLRFNIANLERKNQKRRNSIVALTTPIISKKPVKPGKSRDRGTEFTTKLLLLD